MNATLPIPGQEHKYYFTDLLGARILWQGKKIGKLADMVVTEQTAPPTVTHLFVHRPFGDPPLFIPWETVETFGHGEITVHMAHPRTAEGLPRPGAILLKDHILDKKVIDVEDRDVEVVYDLKMILKDHVLSVSDVNISRYRLFRRLGLKWLVKPFYVLFGSPRDRKIPWDFVQPLPPALDSFTGDVKLKVMKEKLSEIHPAELADILEELDTPQRVAVFSELETHHASDILEEVDPTVQRDLVAALKKERVALLLTEMTTGQAADILSVLPLHEARAILHLLAANHPEFARKIESILHAQEERILNFTTGKLIDLPESTPVPKALEQFLHEAKDRDVVVTLYVVDGDHRLTGVMGFKELLRAAPEKTLKEAMNDNVVKLKSDSTLREAFALFSRYHFRSLPVVDHEGKLLGIIPYRDVMQLKHKFVE